jgi:hypothetical protein
MIRHFFAFSHRRSEGVFSSVPGADLLRRRCLDVEMQPDEAMDISEGRPEMGEICHMNDTGLAAGCIKKEIHLLFCSLYRQRSTYGCGNAIHPAPDKKGDYSVKLYPDTVPGFIGRGKGTRRIGSVCPLPGE